MNKNISIFLNIIPIILALIGLGVNIYRYGEQALYPIVYTLLIVHSIIQIVKVRKDGK